MAAKKTQMLVTAAERKRISSDRKGGKKKATGKRKKVKMSPAMKRNQAKMKKIAKKWNKSDKKGKYTEFVKREMKK